MRKWLLFLVIFLWSCEAEPVLSKPVIKEEIIEEEVAIEPVMIREETVDALVKLANKEMRIIEIDQLHTLMSNTLIESIDFNASIETQKTLIESIIYEHVMQVRRDLIDKIIMRESIDLTTEEKALLIEKTTYQEMYQLMLTYEMVFLKQYEQ